MILFLLTIKNYKFTYTILKLELSLELITSVFPFNAWACYLNSAASKTHLMDEQLLAVFWDTTWFDFEISFS